jgi:hypothetical protein
MSSRDKTTKPGSAKPSSGKASGVSKKPGVKFDISEEDLGKASGGVSRTAYTMAPAQTCAISSDLTRSGRG